MGPAGTGSETAVPIWNEIMKAWIGDRTDPPKFEPPGNIVFALVNRGTGDAVTEGTEGAITEAFIAGTQPGSGFRQ
jgi:membrane carboxypeptidase/penicillin-binding protein